MVVAGYDDGASFLLFPYQSVRSIVHPGSSNELVFLVSIITSRPLPPVDSRGSPLLCPLPFIHPPPKPPLPPAGRATGMSSLSEAPSGSNDLNAPMIPDWLHYWEKVFLTGTLVSAILYGIQLLYARLSILTLCLIYCSRGCYRFILPMYEHVALSRQSHKGGHQVEICGPHRRYVLVCDDIHRSDPQSAIQFLRRPQRLSRYHKNASWTCWIHVVLPL